ncbi:MAG TPA: hypothetical protein ENN67_02515 [Firmicutes bacterium]|nr:hypothetical protein [Bacillota bacterium]
MKPESLIIYLTCVIFLVSLIGCGVDPSNPLSVKTTSDIEEVQTSRHLWGLWNVEIIPDQNDSAEIIFMPMRISQAHINIVGLLESAGPAAVGIDPKVVLKNGILDVDIKLTHPYEGNNFAGFDVRGILIGHGSMDGFSKAFFYAGPNDMQLLNADGHTTLWNPTQYKGTGYIDGKMGKPDSIANFTATLNGFKYFAEGLGKDMKIADMPTNLRGAFLPKSSNVRHYKIKLGDKGLTFQYAIDINWWKPSQPVEIPDSFDVMRANCPEPYDIDVYISPGITGYGGTAQVVIDVRDWQNNCDTVYLEAPLLTDTIQTLSNPEDMSGFKRFTTSIVNEKLPAENFADILIYGEGTDPENLKTYANYRLFRLPLAKVPDGGVIITLQDDMHYKTIGTEYTYGGSSYDYGGGNPPPVDYSDTDGVWDFTLIPNDGTGTRKAIPKDDPEVAGFAGDFSSSTQYFWRTEFLVGDDAEQIYQAESHSESTNKLRLWGIYEEENLQGSVPFDPPIDFPYPMDKTTYYKVTKTYTVIPFILTFKITFERWGIGEGVAFVPVEPGLYGWGWDTQAALETRTIASFETGGLMGQGLLGTALQYEWIADDGIGYGSIVSGNSPDNDPNFDESTFEIIGVASAQALRAIN